MKMVTNQHTSRKGLGRMRTWPSIVTVWLCVLMFAAQAKADDAAQPNLLHVASRIFDVSVPFLRSYDNGGIQTVNLSSVDWLDDYLNQDPLLSHIEFFLRGSNMSALQNVLKNSRPIPPEFLPWFVDYSLPGYTKRTGVAPLLGFYPMNYTYNHNFSCYTYTDAPKTLAMCVILVEYPFDRNINLSTRVQFPREKFPLPWGQHTADKVAAMVNRMIEVAYCLDVTDRVTHEVSESDVRATMADCKLEVMS